MDDQITLFSTHSASELPPCGFSSTASSPDAFGCCSRFRACSDAQKCLIADTDYSLRCSYRKNLENGQVFYGKNAVDFSLSEYATFCNAVNALPAEVKSEYFRMLVYFWSVKYAVSSVLWDSTPTVFPLESLGLCTIASSLDKFLSLCNDKELRKRLTRDPTYGPEWAAVNHKDKRQKYFLCDWIKRHALPFIVAYAKKYVLLSLPVASRRYSQEFYYDYLQGMESDYQKALPFERNDDGLFNV